MQIQKINLLLSSICVMALLFSVPFYNNWLYSKVLSKDGNIFYQVNHLSERERSENKLGPSYRFYEGMVRRLKNEKNPIVLLPPVDYVKMRGYNGDELGEPAVIYYFSGIKCVYHNSPGVENANWALISDKNKLVLRKIESRQALDSLLTLYTPYVN